MPSSLMDCASSYFFLALLHAVASTLQAGLSWVSTNPSPAV